MDWRSKEPTENMNTARNICPKCGGKLLIEAIGNYGDIYRMRADGEMSKRRIKRVIYGGTGDYIIYCEQCSITFDTEDYGF